MGHNIDPNKNCHEYCEYAKYCRYRKGSDGMDPENCAMYYKIEDLMFDADEIAKEQRKRREQEFEDTEDW